MVAQQNPVDVQRNLYKSTRFLKIHRQLGKRQIRANQLTRIERMIKTPIHPLFRRDIRRDKYRLFMGIWGLPTVQSTARNSIKDQPFCNWLIFSYILNSIAPPSSRQWGYFVKIALNIWGIPHFARLLSPQTWFYGLSRRASFFG